MELEKIYRYLVRQLKAKKKELKKLNEEKFTAISEGEVRECHVKIMEKEAEFKTIKETIDYVYDISEPKDYPRSEGQSPSELLVRKS